MDEVLYGVSRTHSFLKIILGKLENYCIYSHHTVVNVSTIMCWLKISLGFTKWQISQTFWYVRFIIYWNCPKSNFDLSIVTKSICIIKLRIKVPKI